MQQPICDICEKPFDKEKQKPLLLDCQCIRCRKCLKPILKAFKRFHCELHNQYTSKNIKDLPLVNEVLRENPLSVGSNFCQTHQKIKDLYCKTDNFLICRICGITSHQGHQFVSLEQKLKELQSQNKEQLQTQ